MELNEMLSIIKNHGDAVQSYMDTMAKSLIDTEKVGALEGEVLEVVKRTVIIIRKATDEINLKGVELATMEKEFKEGLNKDLSEILEELKKADWWKK